MIAGNIRRSFGLLDDTLAKSAYVAGSMFSAADIQVYFGAKALQNRGGLSDYPNVERWLKTCEGRLAYKSACQKGGALFESWFSHDKGQVICLFFIFYNINLSYWLWLSARHAANACSRLL